MDLPSLAPSIEEKKRESSINYEKGFSDWEQLLKKFSEAHQEKCRAVPVDMPKVKRSLKNFPTGSSYVGTWDLLGMSGSGTYTFPNGVEYIGEFSDGMFHGSGELRYPSGEVIRGTWENGKLVTRELFFDDELQYFENNWGYCRMPDRRFTIEHKNGLQPAGESYMTATQPPREIPRGFYDTGDGFYDPKCKVIYRDDDLKAILRSPSEHEQKWIIANGRTNPVAVQGPRLELYEKWVVPDNGMGVQEPTFENEPAKLISFKERELDTDSEAQFEYYHQEFRYGASTYDLNKMASNIGTSQGKYHADKSDTYK